MTERAATGGADVQVELLSPAELDAALLSIPVVYMPLGSLEFHGSHLPIGLDALTAHGLCVRAATRGGGLVLPPLFQGIGGGHTSYPWTIMMPSADLVSALIETTLSYLESFDVKLAILFTGHFADEQLAMIDQIAERWNATGLHSLRVLATGVNRNESGPLAPDHAGIFESSLLYAMNPGLVHVDRLPSQRQHPSIDPSGDPAGAHRHDPSHPLWGVFGPDPRDLDAANAVQLSEAMTAWLARLAAEELAR
ncbi:MAG TPA: creatininase family protein [Nitrolancea sp.]|nr:creatininase family protein [Nitrolancea sp.]